MERVETLCNLLAEKVQKKASFNELLDTVKMLESELIHLINITPPDAGASSSAAVTISKQWEKEDSGISEKNPSPEKTVEILQVDEAEIEAELEEIKKNAAERNKISLQNKPHLLFDDVNDIPTLAGRKPMPPASPEPLKPKEIHELLPVNNSISLNETLRKPQNEVSDKLMDSPVKDLKKAIGVNERYNYINELFRGDEAMYERSIKTINGFAIYPEAEYWIRRELKLKLAWEDKNETVQQFDQLVRRRFA